MNKVMDFMLGMVLGGLVGSAVALLITPMSGDELRMEVKEYSRQVRHDVEEAANARRLELERELASLRREVLTD